MRYSSVAFFLGAYCLLALPGCNSGDGQFKEYTPSEVTEDDHDHDHHEFGPHEGHVIELGDHEYHAELVFDAETPTVTVYLFGHDLDEPLSIDQPAVSLTLLIDGAEQVFELAAAPMEGDADGAASRFQLAGDSTIAEHFDDVEDLQGHVSMMIEGKSYQGEIAHDHDHDHDHDADGDDHDGHGDDHSIDATQSE